MWWEVFDFNVSAQSNFEYLSPDFPIKEFLGESKEYKTKTHSFLNLKTTLTKIKKLMRMTQVMWDLSLINLIIILFCQSVMDHLRRRILKRFQNKLYDRMNNSFFYVVHRK